MRVSSVALLISLISHTAVCAENYKVISSNKAQIMLVDADEDIIRSRDDVELWSVTLRAPNHFLIQNIAVIKMLNEFDCAGDKWRETAMTTYRQDYSLLNNTYSPKEQWRPIPPDTQNAEVKKFACGSPAFRASRPSLGNLPLGRIISSVYSGPWPAQ